MEQMDSGSSDTDPAIEQQRLEGMTLAELVSVLAEARQRLKGAQQKEAAEKARLLQDPVYVDATYALSVIRDAADLTEMIVRKQAEALAAATHDKHTHEAIEVKTMTSVELLTEIEQARQWCLENFKPALTLDRKMFDKAVQMGTVPGWIAKVHEEAKAYVKSDLTPWLPEGEHVEP